MSLRNKFSLWLRKIANKLYKYEISPEDKPRSYNEIFEKGQPLDLNVLRSRAREEKKKLGLLDVPYDCETVAGSDACFSFNGEPLIWLQGFCVCPSVSYNCSTQHPDLPKLIGTLSLVGMPESGHIKALRGKEGILVGSMRNSEPEKLIFKERVLFDDRYAYGISVDDLVTEVTLSFSVLEGKKEEK